MDGFENKPLPIEDVEGQSDGAETNDTSDEETRLAECSSAMKDNLRNEQIDSDNDGDVDSILQTLDNCEGNEVSKITSIPSRQQTEIGGNEGTLGDNDIGGDEPLEAETGGNNPGENNSEGSNPGFE